jgi:hypothetical protein
MLISGAFTTRSPLSHISETISIGSLLNERPITQENGEIVNIFCYNANAWRGQLRDNMALYLIDALKIGELSTEVHNFLFSGGKIGGASKFKLDEVRKHYHLLPHFALFGGCLNNMMLPGKASVLDALPICQEAITELPKKLHNQAVECTYRKMTIERSFTRMDDSKNMKLNNTINIDPKEEKDVIQMRMSSELLNSGVELFSRIILNMASDLEVGSLCSALTRFSVFPFIGGQHNKGHGKVDLKYTIDDELFFEVTDFEVKTGDYFDKCLAEYNQHLKDNSDKIIGLLQ